MINLTNTRLIIYLNDVIIIGKTLEVILMSQDTIILLLQHLRFAIEKSQFDPRTEIEFLGLKINPVKDHSYMSSTRKGKGVSLCRILISFVFLVSFFVLLFSVTRVEGVQICLFLGWRHMRMIPIYDHVPTRRRDNYVNKRLWESFEREKVITKTDDKSSSPSPQ